MYIVLTLLVLVFFIGKAFFSFTKPPDSNDNFSTIMGDNVKAASRVVDVAMLGAHDAFSDKINGKSNFDPHSNSAYDNAIAKFFLSGLIARNAKAQKSSPLGLLKRGARYFDVRITCYNDNWYTHHVLVSGRLEAYLLECIEFLKNNPSEFIVFDIQHVNLGDKTFDDLWNYMQSVRFEGAALTDFVAYDPFNTPLDGLTYGKVTENGGGAVILAKTGIYENCFHYNYENSMRSVWHNKTNTADILAGIDTEYKTLKENSQLDGSKFRVNQAQTTPSLSRIFEYFSGWSLLDYAAKHNARLAAHNDFLKWLEVMPVFMVDFSDSAKGSFNKTALEKINRFNKDL